MLIVKKFGGTSVANKERIFNVANRCIEEYRKGNDVVVVLSAMGKYTDELITMARDVNEKPPKRGSSCGFPECFSGFHAYDKQSWKCTFKKN